jgi:phosphodiesterase/alkaline phosphatase D-like protein
MSLGLAVGATVVAGTAAEAAVLPSVVTGPPSGVAVTEATVSGDVDPNGATTTYDFEYGTTVVYGLHTAVVSAGLGTHEYGVAAHLDGLTPGTTYYYRLVARNSLGASYGSAATFRTPAHAPTILTSSFVSVGDAH